MSRRTRRGALVALAALAGAVVVIAATGGRSGGTTRGRGAGAPIVLTAPGRPARSDGRSDPVERGPGSFSVARAFLAAELAFEQSPGRGARRAIEQTGTPLLASQVLGTPPHRPGPAGSVRASDTVASGRGWRIVAAGVTYPGGASATYELELIRQAGRWRVAELRVR